MTAAPSFTPDKCCEARALLGWSRAELAEAARLPTIVVEMFEADDLHGLGLSDCEIMMREALEDGGVWFSAVDTDSVRFNPAAAPRPTPLRAAIALPARRPRNWVFRASSAKARLARALRPLVGSTG